MSNEKQKILELLENGKINAQEASKLLDSLKAPEENTPEDRANTSGNAGVGRKLRVYVNGGVPEYPKIDVKVSVPVALAHMVDNLIANCMPDSASEELTKQGINLKALNLGELVETLGGLDEDIVNVDIDSEETKIKVRAYVE